MHKFDTIKYGLKCKWMKKFSTWDIREKKKKEKENVTFIHIERSHQFIYPI